MVGCLLTQGLQSWMEPEDSKPVIELGKQGSDMPMPPSQASSGCQAVKA